MTNLWRQHEASSASNLTSNQQQPKLINGLDHRETRKLAKRILFFFSGATKRIFGAAALVFGPATVVLAATSFFRRATKRIFGTAALVLGATSIVRGTAKRIFGSAAIVFGAAAVFGVAAGKRIVTTTSPKGIVASSICSERIVICGS